MTIKQAIKGKLCTKEIEAIKNLKEKNQLLYSIDYKLDLSFFKDITGKINHLLCWEKDELVGYVALSHFDPKELEVTVITNHDDTILDHISRALMDFTELKKCQTILWIIDHKDTFSLSYVKKMTKYDYRFSEYALTLTIDKFVPHHSMIVLQPAKPEDANAIASLENGEFTENPALLDAEDLKQTVVLKENDHVIASIRVQREGNSYGIYGFVVRSDFRGQGIGRKILSQIIQQLLENQAQKIYLEVEATNDNARHLYRSIGFDEQTLFDYYSCEMNK